MVNVHQAKTHLSRLIDEAHAGETIVLAKAGKPWARLMPLEAVTSERIPGRLKRWGPPAHPDELLKPMAADELAAWQDQSVWPLEPQP